MRSKEHWFDNSPRSLLGLLLIYRLVICLLLGGLFLYEGGTGFFGNVQPVSFAVTILTYLALILIDFLLSRSPDVSAQKHAVLIAVFDSVIIVALMHFSGGPKSGVEVLLIITIMNSILVTGGNHAFFIAAIASFTLLGETVLTFFYQPERFEGSTLAGFVSVIYFFVALSVRYLAKRILRFQAIENRQRIDLQNQDELNEFIIEHIDTGILVVDNSDHSIQKANQAAIDLLGKKQIPNKQHLHYVLSSLNDNFNLWLEDKTPNPQVRSADGARNLGIKFYPIGRKTAESGTAIFLEDADLVNKQAQSFKLAALGKLAANIAHEIRNPLSSISHAAQLLIESPDLHENDKSLVNMMTGNATRIDKIIENTLSSTRETKTQIQRIELGKWITTLAPDLKQNKPHTLDIDIDDKLVVYADASQLSQIVVNLIGNAEHHFDRDPTDLVIKVTGKLNQHEHPILRICDNGPGVDPDYIEKIYDPFFSTSSKGTGLGLHITRDLCERNKLLLDYSQAVGGGSCFTLTFLGFDRD